jgi:hypothetical protein
MVSLASLWAPILLSAVLATLAGFVFWIALPFRRRDWNPLPDEAALAESLRRQGAGPGQYAFPFARDPKKRGDPELVRRYESGPVGFLTLARPGVPAMGRGVAWQFAYHVVVGVFVAYLASRTVPAGGDPLEVVRVVGTAATLAYCAAVVPTWIWLARPWSVVWKDLVEGLVVAMLTAGVFVVFWPR